MSDSNRARLGALALTLSAAIVAVCVLLAWPVPVQAQSAPGIPLIQIRVNSGLSLTGEPIACIPGSYVMRSNTQFGASPQALACPPEGIVTCIRTTSGGSTDCFSQVPNPSYVAPEPDCPAIGADALPAVEAAASAVQLIAGWVEPMGAAVDQGRDLGMVFSVGAAVLAGFGAARFVL